MMQQLAKLKFRSLAIKLPKDWRQPQGQDGKMLVDALKPEERMAIPNPMALFQPASTIKYHVDTANQIGEKFEKFIDGIISAICSAWSEWQSMTTMAGIIVAGPVATGGQLAGPPLLPLILKSAPMATPNEMKYSNAVAQAMNTAWLAYTATIKIPGLPIWPMFAAFPSPVVPPTPNPVPAPLMSMVQVDATLQVEALKGMMIMNLGDPTALHHMQLFESIADAINKCFTIWKASTMFNNIMGVGATPSMALPIPVPGPVVGTAIMSPGGIT